MSISEETRQEMLREVFEYSSVPLGRPGDVTARDVVEDALARGRKITRSTAAIWLRAMGEAAGWETELAWINGRRTRVWRKPAKD